MDHPVVIAAAEHAAARGLLTLRFDFRGVRQSEGSESDVAGHLEDWRQALLDVRRRNPGGCLLAGGFSYGARSLTAVLQPRAPRHPAVEGVLLLGPATRVPRTRRDFGNLLLGRPLHEAARDAEVLAQLEQLPVRSEIIVGAADVVAPPEELAAHLPAEAHLQVLEGLNHFFSRHPGAGPLDEAAVGAALDEALERLI